MVLAGLRDGYSWEFDGYPSLKPASTISTDIPRNIPENIPPLESTISDNRKSLTLNVKELLKARKAKFNYKGKV